MNRNTNNTNRDGTPNLRRSNAATGVTAASALLLVYGLLRPDSLAFSIPFLIVPSVVMLWTVQRTPTRNERRTALVVTLGIAIAAMAIVLGNRLSG
jgi:hypothetical protein